MVGSSFLVRRVCVTAIVVAGFALSASSARAAGFWIYEMGTPDLGTASAGRAASAQDAATVFGNPAGMTSLDRSQLLAGTELIVGDVHFNRGGDTTVAGGNGGNASGTVPGISFYYAHSVTPKIKLGFWSGSYFGGALEYEDNWSGRYYVQKVQLLTLGAGINGAYKINDWLSIGGGPLVLYGDLEQRVALNNLLVGQDGRLKFEDDEFGFGGMAGVMLEPLQGTRVGVTYTSPVELDFKDTPSTKNLGAEQSGPLHAAGRPRTHGAAGGHAQRLPPAQRPPRDHGQPSVAELESVRQTRHLDRRQQRQQRNGQPQLRRYLGLRARGAVRVRGRLAVVVRRRLRQLAGRGG
jgi:long-subunit fatty acid transport protein